MVLGGCPFGAPALLLSALHSEQEKAQTHFVLFSRTLTVELNPSSDAKGCCEDLSITYFRISKRWDRFLVNLLGETLVQ